MNSNIFNAIGLGTLDPAILFIVMLVLIVVLLILVIVQGSKFKKLEKKYNKFMGLEISRW